MAQRKLSNLQMNILAERATDLLEEVHNAATAAVKSSPGYLKFEEHLLTNDPTAADLAKLLEEYTVTNEKLDSLKQKASELNIQLDLKCYDWRGVEPDRLYKAYVEQAKQKQFPDINFNRDKILRRLQADILLSDIENPEQLIKELVEKHK